MLQRALFIGSLVSFEEVVVLAQLVLYLAHQELPPLDEHILGDALVMRVLHLPEIFQFLR